MVRAFRRTRRAAVIAALIAAPGAGARGATRGACASTGYTTAPRGDDTAARAHARRRGTCRCENSGTIRTIGFILDWFTLKL